MKYQFKFILFFFALLLSQSINAQITIGSKEKPVQGALLQLKDITQSESTGLENATRGLALPRVALTKRYQLMPMFANQLEDYNTNKATYDAEHTGLLVYNTEANASEIICKGLNVWDGEQWQCLKKDVNYSIDCSSVHVRGVYRFDETLDPSKHYIELTLTTDENSIGGIYHIKTETIDGISFEGKGVLTSTTQTVQLQGKGKSTNYEIKNFTISTNSSRDKSTCSATVYIVLTPKTILGIGSASGTFGYFVESSGSLAVMKKSSNFGVEENSTVKIEDFKYNYITSVTPSDTQLATELAKKPDIVVVGYASGFTTATINRLIDYMNQGGVVLLFCENSSAANLFKTLFNDNTISSALRNTRGRSYRLPTVDDEVLNGPFGDARGGLWGEDASSTLVIEGLPLDKIEVYSGGTCLGGTTYPGVSMFRHKTQNLFFVGDGGFLSNNATFIGQKYTDSGACPFALDANHKPVTRITWGEGTYTNQTVYNSIIFANLMTWAIYKAHFHGINAR